MGGPEVSSSLANIASAQFDELLQKGPLPVTTASCDVNAKQLFSPGFHAAYSDEKSFLYAIPMDFWIEKIVVTPKFRRGKI